MTRSRKIGTIDLANGVTRQHSGEVAIEVDDSGNVVLRVHKHHTVTFLFPPSIARRVGSLLLEAAGPDRPSLTLDLVDALKSEKD